MLRWQQPPPTAAAAAAAAAAASTQHSKSQPYGKQIVEQGGHSTDTAIAAHTHAYEQYSK
jgi:gamma-glutamyltranspeptidase